jgi:hypothetical protein
MRKISLFICVLVFISVLFQVLCRDVEDLFIYFILYMFLCYSYCSYVITGVVAWVEAGT